LFFLYLIFDLCSHFYLFNLIDFLKIEISAFIDIFLKKDAYSVAWFFVAEK